MTTRSIISHDPHIATIWPDDGNHALVLCELGDGEIHIIQDGRRVCVPKCALGALMTTLREMSRAAKQENAE